MEHSHIALGFWFTFTAMYKIIDRFHPNSLADFESMVILLLLGILLFVGAIVFILEDME